MESRKWKVETLSGMNAEIRALEAKLSKARAVKAGMMSALLGEGAVGVDYLRKNKTFSARLNWSPI